MTVDARYQASYSISGSNVICTVWIIYLPLSSMYISIRIMVWGYSESLP